MEEKCRMRGRMEKSKRGGKGGKGETNRDMIKKKRRRENTVEELFGEIRADYNAVKLLRREEGGESACKKGGRGKEFRKGQGDESEGGERGQGKNGNGQEREKRTK